MRFEPATSQPKFIPSNSSRDVSVEEKQADKRLIGDHQEFIYSVTNSLFNSHGIKTALAIDGPPLRSPESSEARQRKAKSWVPILFNSGYYLGF